MKRDMKKMAAADLIEIYCNTKMSGITCQMCHSINDVIKYIEGPVIDKNVQVFAKTCLSLLKLNRVPKNALVKVN